MKPRIFISCVSTELRSARQIVANMLMASGYEPVTQDLIEIAPGKLLTKLRKEIESCDGLLQIAGHAYGAEPPEPVNGYGRISYTQFELLHARAHKKKTWLFIATDHYERDTEIHLLDLPKNPETGRFDATLEGAQDYQTERFELQGAYLAHLKQQNHLHHSVGSGVELENKVLRIKNELAILRRKYDRLKYAAIGAVVLLATGIGITYLTLHNSDKHTKDLIKAAEENQARLRESIETQAKSNEAEKKANSDLRLLAAQGDGTRLMPAFSMEKIEKLPNGIKTEFCAEMNSKSLDDLEKKYAGSSKDTDNLPVLLALAGVAYSKGDYETSATYLNKADKLNVSSDTTSYDLHLFELYANDVKDAALKERRYDKAIDALDQAANVISSEPSREAEVYWVRLQAADLALQSGDVLNAKTRYKQLSDLAQAGPARHSATASLLLARACVKLASIVRGSGESDAEATIARLYKDALANLDPAIVQNSDKTLSNEARLDRIDIWIEQSSMQHAQQENLHDDLNTAVTGFEPALRLKDSAPAGDEAWKDRLQKELAASEPAASKAIADWKDLQTRWQKFIDDSRKQLDQTGASDGNRSRKAEVDRRLRDSKTELQMASGLMSQLSARWDGQLALANKQLGDATPVVTKADLGAVELCLRELDVPNVDSTNRCLQRLADVERKLGDAQQKQSAKELASVISNLRDAVNELNAAQKNVQTAESDAATKEKYAVEYDTPNAFGTVRTAEAIRSRAEAVTIRAKAATRLDNATNGLTDQTRRTSEASRIYSNGGQTLIAAALSGLAYAVQDRWMPNGEFEIPLTREEVEQFKGTGKKTTAPK